MATLTTTTALIRDQQAAVIEALLPGSMSSDSFRQFKDETDFRDWAEENSRAALRRFYIEDQFTDEGPTISDTVDEEITTNFEILVAYPRDGRYPGRNNRSDMLDIMTADLHQIDTAIGHRGSSNYVSGQQKALSLEKIVDEGGTDAMDFLLFTYEITYRRAF